MRRILKRELLDELPVTDPGARGSRSDLRLINRLMGSSAGLAGGLRQTVKAGSKPLRLVELGAGDGVVLLGVARRLGWKPVTAVMVDQKPVVEERTTCRLNELGWRAQIVAADVFSWLSAPQPKADVVVANLFLHHFTDEQLRRLLSMVFSRTRCFVAVEPRRSMLSLMGSRLLGVFGCNFVTRHDAPVSVRAGFRDRDLSQLLEENPGLQTCERRLGLFGHLFMATYTSG